MPASFTHQCFGDDVMHISPYKQFIQQHQEMFYLGLQGPDLLFYYHPTKKNLINGRGGMLHEEKAKPFFADAITHMQDEESLVYLLGFACHYSLDHACHPLINQLVKEKHFGHFAIERELDMHFMEVYPMRRKTVAQTFPDDAATCQRIGRILGVEAAIIHTCIRTFRKLNRLLYGHSLLLRKMLSSLIRVLHIGSFSEMFIMKKPDPVMAEDITLLAKRYQQAVNDGAKAIEEIIQAYQQGTPLSDYFNHNYE